MPDGFKQDLPDLKSPSNDGSMTERDARKLRWKEGLEQGASGASRTVASSSKRQHNGGQLQGKAVRSRDGAENVNGDERSDESHARASTSKKGAFQVLNTFAKNAPSPRECSPSVPRTLRPMPPPPPVRNVSNFSTATPKPARPRQAATEVTQAFQRPESFTERSSASGPKQDAKQMSAMNTFVRSPAPVADTPSNPPKKLKPLLSLVSAPPSDVTPSKDSTPVRKRKRLASPPRVEAFPSKRSASPCKPLLSTLPSERALAFIGKIPGPIKQEGRKPFNTLPPPLPLIKTEEEEDEGPDSWSPRKQKKGHVFGGLAARTFDIVTKTRTSHTIWIHELSRTIESRGQGITRSHLFSLVAPSVRLLVLEALPFGTEESRSNARHWEEGRTALARCRLLLGALDDETDGDNEVSPDLEGLVLFSINSHPTASRAAPPPPKRKRPPSTESVTLFLPSNPHDLRFVKEGAEIWVFEEGYHEVVLSTSRKFEDKNQDEGETDTTNEEGPPEDDVFWDTRSELNKAKEKRKQKEEEDASSRVKRALICSKIGFVV